MNNTTSLVAALRNSRVDADITLRCQGVDIRAHSLILETRCKYRILGASKCK